MQEFISNIAYAVLTEVIQLAAGSIISIPVYKVCIYLKGRSGKFFFREEIVIIISAMIGMLLPINIYGILPIAAALLAADFSFAEVVPMLVANTLFNMSVPYTDPMFIWRTGINRVVLACLAGVFGGILLRRFKEPDLLLRLDRVVILEKERDIHQWSKALELIRSNMIEAGAFLLVGVCLNEIFYGYILWPVLQYIYTSPNTAFIPGYFAQLDVVNPFFLQAMNIVHMLMNLVALSGLFVLMKLKGVSLYIGYYVLLAILLGTSAFF